MKFNNLLYIEESGLSYYPIRRQQILDFIINTVDNKSYFDKNENEYLIKKHQLLALFKTAQKREVINLYRNYYLKNITPKISSVLNGFDLHRFPEDVFSSTTHVSEDQIFEDFIEIQVNKHIYRSDILELNYYDRYNYTRQIVALLLLEEFSNYVQKISSINLSESKDYIEISVVFLKDGSAVFYVELKSGINNNFKISNTEEEYLIEINDGCDKEFLRQCAVIKIALALEIPTYTEDEFDYIFNVEKHKKLVFFSKTDRPFPIKYDKYNLEIRFQDITGNSILLSIYNPPVLFTKDFYWLNTWLTRILKSEYVPKCIFPIEHYILSALQGFDFGNITYLSDHFNNFKEKSENLMFSDNKKISFFISAADHKGQHFNKSEIFKIDINIEKKESKIEFYGFEEDQ